MKIKKAFFVGIGGMGVSSVAGIALENGIKVLGYDQTDNYNTQHLKEQGAIIYNVHDCHNVESDTDVVVVSSAIPFDSPEIKIAKKNNIPILHRSQMLDYLLKEQKVIAIAGTHGKTTTTSMVASVLLEGKYEPTVSIGGKWSRTNSTYYNGEGRYAVIEADESDGSFLNYHPYIGVITNMEYEHVDFYTSNKMMEEFFCDFVCNISQSGGLVICQDDVNEKNMIWRSHINKKVVTYGVKKNANIIAKDIITDNEGVRFKVYVQNEDRYDFWREIKLNNLFGIHNVKNALAAIGVGTLLKIKKDVIVSGLEQCGNIGRRMELVSCGQLEILSKVVDGIKVYQDYGHHPTEISATLDSLRDIYGAKRIITVFQPHRFSRTRAFLSEFANSLMKSDYVLLTDVYAAFENVDEKVEVSQILEKMKLNNYQSCDYFKNKEELYVKLSNVLLNDDVLLILGAGDIEIIVNDLKKMTPNQDRKD